MDAIDRQAAIDVVEGGAELIRRVLDNMDVVNGERGKFAYGLGLLESCIEDLSGLPSAQQWVPCSERLPEKPNMYTVTDSKGDVVRFVFYDNESSREYWRRCAKAWMPLPEPYEGEK